MVRQPQSLAEAKQIFREEKTKVTSSVAKIAGSRWLLAILATFALAFGTHLAFAPGRLPPVSGLALTLSALPEGVDFGLLGEQAGAAREAAERQGVEEKAATLAAEHADRIPLANVLGFALALILLGINLFVMTKRRPYSRG